MLRTFVCPDCTTQVQGILHKENHTYLHVCAPVFEHKCIYPTVLRVFELFVLVF